MPRHNSTFGSGEQCNSMASCVLICTCILQMEYILFGSSHHFNSDKQFHCRGHREHMRNMDRLFQDPFGMFGGHPMLQGPGRSDPQSGTRAVAQWNPAEMSPFGFGNMFGSMFMNMNSMMSNMERSFVSKIE